MTTKPAPRLTSTIAWPRARGLLGGDVLGHWRDRNSCDYLSRPIVKLAPLRVVPWQLAVPLRLPLVFLLRFKFRSASLKILSHIHQSAAARIVPRKALSQLQTGRSFLSEILRIHGTYVSIAHTNQPYTSE